MRKSRYFSKDKKISTIPFLSTLLNWFSNSWKFVNYINGNRSIRNKEFFKHLTDLTSRPLISYCSLFFLLSYFLFLGINSPLEFQLFLPRGHLSISLGLTKNLQMSWEHRKKQPIKSHDHWTVLFHRGSVDWYLFLLKSFSFFIGWPQRALWTPGLMIISDTLNCSILMFMIMQSFLWVI